MVYNRCVGTRYCSNNCPYKVRRFNFLDYRGTMSPDREDGDEPRRHRPDPRRDGEVHLLRAAHRAAPHRRAPARGGRSQDGEFTTACAQACPAEAIVFGNLNDPQSRGVEGCTRTSARYDVLHELGTRPRTAYLVRIRNPNPELT